MPSDAPQATNIATVKMADAGMVPLWRRLPMLAVALVTALTGGLTLPATAQLAAPAADTAATPAPAKPTPTPAMAPGKPAAAAADAAKGAPATADRLGPGDDTAAMSRFLDRLMLAESGGRDDARNARSTAVGAFQFIERTFLDVAQRHLATETASLAPSAVLALRANRPIARKAAEAYTRDNAALLAASGIEATFANLRLAFLVGPGGAIRVLKAPAQSLAIAALGAAVVQANPFMAGMTAHDLASWAERNLSGSELARARVAVDPSRVAGAKSRRKPAIAIHCNQELASCRHWVALAQRRATAPTRVADRRAGRRSRR